MRDKKVLGRRPPSVCITTLDHYWHPQVLTSFENSSSRFHCSRSLCFFHLLGQ